MNREDSLWDTSRVTSFIDITPGWHQNLPQCLNFSVWFYNKIKKWKGHLTLFGFCCVLFVTPRALEMAGVWLSKGIMQSSFRCFPSFNLGHVTAGGRQRGPAELRHFTYTGSRILLCKVESYLWCKVYYLDYHGYLFTGHDFTVSLHTWNSRCSFNQGTNTKRCVCYCFF